jgi:hypothetical protein
VTGAVVAAPGGAYTLVCPPGVVPPGVVPGIVTDVAMGVVSTEPGVPAALEPGLELTTLRGVPTAALEPGLLLTTLSGVPTAALPLEPGLELTVLAGVPTALEAAGVQAAGVVPHCTLVPATEEV